LYDLDFHGERYVLKLRSELDAGFLEEGSKVLYYTPGVIQALQSQALLNNKFNFGFKALQPSIATEFITISPFLENSVDLETFKNLFYKWKFSFGHNNKSASRESFFRDLKSDLSPFFQNEYFLNNILREFEKDIQGYINKIGFALTYLTNFLRSFATSFNNEHENYEGINFATDDIVQLKNVHIDLFGFFANLNDVIIFLGEKDKRESFIDILSLCGLCVMVEPGVGWKFSD